jgi:hypothetical protein
MVRLANIIQEKGSEFRHAYNGRLTPEHYDALSKIERCRTEAMGGGVYECNSCEATHYHYHSCRNRHCPQCQYQAGETWLEKQQTNRLPTHYFMLTFTLPQQLRAVAMQEGRTVYSLLMKCAAEATQLLAKDERYIGGEIGMLGVLHTWGRNLSYHPHVHFLVPGGGLTPEGKWRSTSHNFFLPVKALSKIFRAKMRDGLKKTAHFDTLPHSLWHTPWVVHSQHVGQGEQALNYLAPYIFRVAISDKRIVQFTGERVTFRYRETATGNWRSSTLDVFEFLRRFLHHVLPKRFVKVRYYGLFSPAKRPLLAQALAATPSPSPRKRSSSLQVKEKQPPFQPTCPHCGEQLRLRYKLFMQHHRPLALGNSNHVERPP